MWVAICFCGKIVAFSPHGKIERAVEMPVRLVFVTFGGANLEHLYITTIAHGIDGDAPQQGAGLVYVIEGLNVRGVPEPRFAG